MSDEVKSMGSASADTALDHGSSSYGTGGGAAQTTDHASIVNGGHDDDADNASVLRRKKPIAGWRLASIFAWCVSSILLSIQSINHQ